MVNLGYVPSAKGFDGQAGALIVAHDGTDQLIMADVNGNGVEDFRILLADAPVLLEANDFFL